MTYEPKPGDRIRQTIVSEGVVQPEGKMAVADNGCRFFVDPDAYSSRGTVTNELIEQHYPVGSLWLDADGTTLERTDSPDRPWRHPPEKGGTYSEAIATRPLTRLYREGEQGGAS